MRIFKLGACLLIVTCGGCEKAPEAPPKNVQEVARRTSEHGEWGMSHFGLTQEQANSCFEKLNDDMDAHPEFSLANETHDRRRLTRIEEHQKDFLDRCFEAIG